MSSLIICSIACMTRRINPPKSWYWNLDRVTTTNGDYEATFHLKQPQPALLANGPGSSQYKRSPALIPPRFGAKPLEQQRDWRISGEYDRRPIVIPSFPKKLAMGQMLRGVSTGVKVGRRFTHKGSEVYRECGFRPARAGIVVS
jgi:hypothetical protein